MKYVYFIFEILIVVLTNFFNSSHPNFQANGLILKCYADFQNVVVVLE